MRNGLVASLGRQALRSGMLLQPSSAPIIAPQSSSGQGGSQQSENEQTTVDPKRIGLLSHSQGRGHIPQHRIKFLDQIAEGIVPPPPPPPPVNNADGATATATTPSAHLVGSSETNSNSTPPSQNNSNADATATTTATATNSSSASAAARIDRRSLAKALTLVESTAEGAARESGYLLRQLQKRRNAAPAHQSLATTAPTTKMAPTTTTTATTTAAAATRANTNRVPQMRIAISGAPGAGKSTFIEALGLYLTGHGPLHNKKGSRSSGFKPSPSSEGDSNNKSTTSTSSSTTTTSTSEKEEKEEATTVDNDSDKKAANKAKRFLEKAGKAAASTTISSSMFDELKLLRPPLSLAVLAVDPSSTVNGGSILGDKTRMEGLGASEVTNCMVRPQPSRGHLGGVTARTDEAMAVLEAAGYETVLLETVGVGQSETQAGDMTDLFVLVLSPAAGDDLQGVKKGIVERADIIIVNKADGASEVLAAHAVAHYKSAAKLNHMHSTTMAQHSGGSPSGGGGNGHGHHPGHHGHGSNNKDAHHPPAHPLSPSPSPPSQPAVKGPVPVLAVSSIKHKGIPEAWEAMRVAWLNRYCQIHQAHQVVGEGSSPSPSDTSNESSSSSSSTSEASSSNTAPSTSSSSSSTTSTSFDRLLALREAQRERQFEQHFELEVVRVARARLEAQLSALHRASTNNKLPTKASPAASQPSSSSSNSNSGSSGAPRLSPREAVHLLLPDIVSEV